MKEKIFIASDHAGFELKEKLVDHYGSLFNDLGTNNVLKAAVQNKIKKVIVLSTDKAAYPINAMGMSKALMEKVAVAASRNINQKSTKIYKI